MSALYTQQKCATLEALESSTVEKRIELILQKELSAAQVSRYFLSDFDAAATHDEAVRLIHDIWALGELYGSLPPLRKGDVITIDWIPGKGLLVSMNAKPLTAPSATTPYFNNPLLGGVIFRMFVGGKTSAELRDNLLGTSKSMRD